MIGHDTSPTRRWRIPGRKHVYRLLDHLFVSLDQQRTPLPPNVLLIPAARERHRRRSYTAWAHTAGAFQALLGTQLLQRRRNRILDIGCGSGLMAIAAEPFVRGGGQYVGIDVDRQQIEFCRGHYPAQTHSFVHLDSHNASYTPGQSAVRVPWPFAPASFDAVTALSVWTHFAEEDAVFYFSEVDRVLRPGGRALLTFFVLDDDYEEFRGSRADTGSGRRLFDRPAYDSKDWRCANWTRVPEQAIGVTPRAIARMLEPTRLLQIAQFAGEWKDQPGVTLQDVLVFQKTEA